MTDHLCRQMSQHTLWSSLPKDVSGGIRLHGLRKHLDKSLEEEPTELLTK